MIGRMQQSSEPFIGIVGDHNPAYPLHRATEEALGHVAAPLPLRWLPTDELEQDGEARLSDCRALIVAPGSPYRSMEGALRAIRFARERQVPLLGTCGGFQHVVLEYARNVLGIADADHQETSPKAPRLVVTALACSLAGQEHAVRLTPGSRVAALYGTHDVVEPFFCSYGLNPQYRTLLEQNGLAVTGLGEDGEVRVMESPAHPFYLATLYVPQARSRGGHPHPLIGALVAAARESQPAPSS